VAEIEYKANFNWDITKRKLVIFLPSFKYPELTEFAISQIQTQIPEKDWIIIIGNDNVDVNWDHLKDKNVRYFTLLRTASKPRNSSFIRNYAIKRCKSEIFLQKDAEVVILGDFVYNVINSRAPWRPGKVYVLDEEQTKMYLETKDFMNIRVDPTKVVKEEVGDDLFHVKSIIAEPDGSINLATYFHYAFAVKTKVLQEIRGYDEDYVLYGYNDSDLFCRLYHLGQYIIPDHTCTAIHLYHPVRSVNCGSVESVKMREIFIAKDPSKVQRNPIVWGRGYV